MTIGFTRTLITAGVAATTMSLGGLTTPASALTAPANDNFANAQFIPGPTKSISGTNVGATAEPGEPQHVAGVTPTHSVWYTWTAPATGHVVFRTQGSNFDTVLAAYQGDSLSRSLPVASNDDTPLPDGSVRQSQIRFGVRGGDVYRIVVDGFNAASVGQVKLSWTSNDDFAAAQPLSGPALGSFSTVGGNTVGTERETGEPFHAGGFGSVGSVWYTWTAPVTAKTELTTVSANFDNVLAVYTGSSLTGLTQVAAATNGSPTTPGVAPFTATAGTTYRVAVSAPQLEAGGTARNQGSFVLRVQQFGPRISVGDVSVSEGNSGTKTIAFPVTLSQASSVPITVNFATTGGTALATSDYVAKSGTKSIPAGTTSVKIAVTVNGDTVVEPTEQFSLLLSNPQGAAATILDGTAVGTIVNDD